MKIYNQELNEESKNIINDYYQKSKSHLISKKDFARAIRLFTTLVLFLEEDKENKIKNNCNNIVYYLKQLDLWNQEMGDVKFWYRHPFFLYPYGTKNFSLNF